MLNYIESLKKDEDFKNALWSVKVVNCSTQKTIAEHNSSTNHVPASIMKLITTGVGAINFSNNYRFITTLAYNGSVDTDSVLNGNIYIIISGGTTFYDCSLGGGVKFIYQIAYGLL